MLAPRVLTFQYPPSDRWSRNTTSNHGALATRILSVSSVGSMVAKLIVNCSVRECVILSVSSVGSMVAKPPAPFAAPDSLEDLGVGTGRCRAIVARRSRRYQADLRAWSRWLSQNQSCGRIAAVCDYFSANWSLLAAQMTRR